MPAWFVRIASFCGLALSVQAASGDMDGTFGPRGRVLTSFTQNLGFPGDNGPSSALAVLEQSDGKILTAGYANGNLEIAYARHNQDGTLDGTFGFGGKLNFSVDPGTRLTGMAMQSNGKAVMAGYSVNEGSIIVLRAGSDGMPEQAFGNNGILVLPGQEGSKNTCLGVAVQSDDKIVLVGSYANGSGFLVVRVSANGQLDPSFGTGGMVNVPFVEGGAEANSVQIREDGRIVVGGTCWGNEGADFALACLEASGVLDTTFGQDGKTVLDLSGGDDFCLSIAFREGGKVVAGGMASVDGQQDFAISAFLENGVLDSDFGHRGQAITPLSTGLDKCTSVIVRPDGKIVAVGQAVSSSGFSECVIVRYQADGALDTDFGTSGQVFCPLGPMGGEVNAACLGAGGKIIVAGAGNESSRMDFAVARFTEDGGLDSGFRRGWSVSSFRGYSMAVDTVVQSDGKILVCGSTGLYGFSQMSVARYDSTGELDPNFGTQGVVTTDFGAQYGSYASSMVVQPDGKIIAVGASGREDDWAMARFLPDGTLDSTFGTGGKVVTSLGTGREAAFEVALQPDGKIVVVGSVQVTADYDFALVRYHPDGSLDNSFGTSGKVITALSSGEDVPRALVIQPDGKILVAGRAFNGANTDFAVMRHHTDGSVDLGFGTAGKTLTPMGPGYDGATDMKVQSDGKILLVGGAGIAAAPGVPTDATLVRYLADGSLDEGFGIGGKVVTRLNGQSYTTNAMVLQPDGRIVTVGRAKAPYFGNANGASLVRHNEDGSLDISFGTGGVACAAIGAGATGATGYNVVIQNDGAFLVVGATSVSSTLPLGREWLLARYKPGPLLPMLGSGAALNISTSSTSVNGTVRPNGSTTTAWVEYGPTAAYGSVASIALSPADSTAVQNVSVGLSGLAPGTIYYYRLTASNAAGTRSTAGSTFTTLTLHQGWRQQHFGLAENTGNAADTFDFDSDGLPNLLEWACGLDPTTGSLLQQATALLGNELEFNYSRSVAALNAGTLFTVEWSDSLVSTSWSSASVIQSVLSDNGVTQQVKAVLPAGENGRRFVRLRVELP